MTRNETGRRGAALAGAVLVVLLAGCATSDAGSGPEGRTPSRGITAAPEPSATGGPGGAGQGGGPAGAGGWVTPSANGATLAERYAYCLREKGIPAVVIDGEVAVEGSGSGTSGGVDTGSQPTAAAQAEAACRADHPDYHEPMPSQGAGAGTDAS